MMLRYTLLLICLVGTSSGEQLRKLDPEVVPVEETEPVICNNPSAMDHCNDYFWYELDKPVKDCYTTLLFSEETWATQVVGEDLLWEDLTDRQLMCAKFLGYGEESFTNEENICYNPSAMDHCNDYFWYELDEPVKDCYTTLLVSEETWETPVVGEDLLWEDLTDRQVMCAHFLGYDEESFTNEENVPPVVEEPLEARICFNVMPQESCEQFWWHELTKPVQTCLALLGYSEASWNHPETHMDPTLFQYYDDLSSTQKACAALFAYGDAGAWDSDWSSMN